MQNYGPSYRGGGGGHASLGSPAVKGVLVTILLDLFNLLRLPVGPFLCILIYYKKRFNKDN